MKNAKIVSLIIIVLLILGGVYVKIEKNKYLTSTEKEWLSNQKTLIYGADNNAPPLRFVDSADNQYKGVVVDYINLLSLELGINIEEHPLLWEDALSNLANGETDICDMFASEERGKQYLFTDPLYKLRGVVAVRKHYENKNGDIKNWKVATQRGDYVNEYLRAKYPVIELVHVSNVKEALDLLEVGLVDAVAGDEPVVFYEISKRESLDYIDVLEQPLYEHEVVLAVSKSKSELVPILNKGIYALEKAGQIERIQQKWFGISTPIVKTEDYITKIKYIIAFCFFLGVVIILMITWNYALKKRVEVKTSELEKSRSDLQITFDGLNEYIAVISMQKSIVNINKSFLEFLKKSKKEVLNKQSEDIFETIMGREVTGIIDRTIELAENLEEEFMNKSEIYFIKTFLLKDIEANNTNILITIENITTEKISKNQIMQANKMVAVGQLAAGVAHEIRNPLGIIRNHSYIMKALYKDEKGVRSIKYIDSAVERASGIIDNLLNFSRITNDEKTEVDVKSLIQGVIDFESKNLMVKNISYQVKCCESLNCYMNSESLKHILINLLSNAIDALNLSGELKISANIQQNQLYISVSDTGCGILEKDLERIFNPFFTTKDVGKGTGLGLYIVYNEVKKLGGDVVVSSVIGEGTAFEIFLPLCMEA